jgi:hypothetical protein
MTTTGFRISWVDGTRLGCVTFWLPPEQAFALWLRTHPTVKSFECVIVSRPDTTDTRSDGGGAGEAGT